MSTGATCFENIIGLSRRDCACAWGLPVHSNPTTMAVKFQGGRMVPAGQDSAGKDIKRKALNSAIQKMQQMKSIAESLRRDFDASTPGGGPLWRQDGYEEIPATVYSHIPDLLDREIRRAQELLAQVR